MHQNSFLIDDSGAVTVDWVVLTAALVGLGLATMGLVSSGVEDLSGDVDDQLQSNSIVAGDFYHRVNSNGLSGAIVWSQSNLNTAATEYGAMGIEDLQAAYTYRQGMLEQRLSNGSFGATGRIHYHNAYYIADRLNTLGAPLPEGATRPNELYDAVVAFDPSVADQTPL